MIQSVMVLFGPQWAASHALPTLPRRAPRAAAQSPPRVPVHLL